MLAIALVGSLAYGVYALTNRDALDPVAGVRGRRARHRLRGARRLLPALGLAGRPRRARWPGVTLGVVGGVAAMVAAGCAAAAIILFQLIARRPDVAPGAVVGGRARALLLDSDRPAAALAPIV